MAEIDVQKKVVDALVIMNTAITNMRLYPPSSAMIVQTIDKLYQAFLVLFTQEATLIFAESEKNILICGEPLSQKDQERPQAVALLEMLLNFGIRSISFKKGLEQAELATFLEIMSRKPESVKSEGGLAQVLASKNLPHILLDQKIYVARNQNQQILAGLGITDDQIIEAVTRAYPDLDADPGKVQDLARDPDWMLGIFQSGVGQFLGQEGAMPHLEMSENVMRMISILDKMAANMDQKDRDRISQSIGKSIADMDLEMVSHILAQNIEDFFGGTLMPNVISQIDDAKMAKINKKSLVQDEKGISGDPVLEDAVPPEKAEAEKEKRVLHLKEEIAPMLNGNEAVFLDGSLMASLPEIVGQLAGYDEQGTIWTILHRLSGHLTSDQAELRAQSSTALAEIMSRLPSGQQSEVIGTLSDRLLAWIKDEELATPAYEKICICLKDFVQTMIRQEHYIDTIPVLDVFYQIDVGLLEKNDSVHAIASEIIRDLASEDLLNVLFDEFNTNKKGKKTEAGRMLVRLGEPPLNRLLDMLRENNDSNERVRILQLMGEVGPMAVPLVRDRINQDEPWYYLRNLAYLLGRVGSEANVGVLRPLLLHENLRVRQEALKSVHRIGGNERGPLLLSLLPSADDAFKVSIVEMLGSLKWAGATAPLLALLKARPLISSSPRNDLEEKICTALGAIGAPEAIPVLSEIKEAKGFLSIRAYSDKVKVAAAKALVSIKRKQTERGSSKG